MKSSKLLYVLSLVPLLHVGGYFLLLKLCESKFGRPMLDSGIDPKDTGYSFLIYVLHLLMLLAFLLMGLYAVPGLIGLLRKKRSLLLACGLYSVSFIVFLLNLLLHPTMPWFFD